MIGPRTLLGDLPQIVAIGVIIGAVIVLVLSITLLVHFTAGKYRAATRRARVRRAAVHLAAAIASGTDLTLSARRARDLEGIIAVSTVLRRARVLLRGDIARRITSALEELGEVRRLEEKSKSIRGWRRANAMRQLGECGGDAAREALIHATNSLSIDVRRAAREGLLVHRERDAIWASTESFVEDESQAVAGHRSFLTRLAEVDAPKAAELIRNGVFSGATEKLALEAIAEQRAAEAVPLAVERLHAAEPGMRAAAVRALGKLRLAGMKAAVTARLSDPSWLVRAAAARALASASCDEHGCELLKRNLEDSVSRVRSNAAFALSQQGRRGIAKLFEAVENDDAFACDAALTALMALDLSTAERIHLAEVSTERGNRDCATKTRSEVASAASASAVG